MPMAVMPVRVGRRSSSREPASLLFVIKVSSDVGTIVDTTYRVPVDARGSVS